MSRLTRIRARMLGCLAALAAIAALALAPAAGAAPTKTYLALGDSLAFGYQQATFVAGLPSPPAASFDHGYVDDFYLGLRLTGKANKLVNDGCPGETTTSYLNGPCLYQAAGFGLHHPYTAGPFSSQKNDALGYIASHPGEVRVITIDLGANDALNVVNGVCSQNPVCIAAQAPALFASIATNLGTAVGQLRAAAPAAKLVVLGLYNPYGTTIAGADALTAQLNTVLNGVVTSLGAKFADPFPVFNPGGPLESQAICALTNMCTPLVDIHPTDLGYAALAAVVGVAYLR